MEDREYIELRSEDVQEILGTPPSALVRWGTSIVLICFAFLLFTAYIMRYPDVIGAKVVLTTAVPPVDVVARTDGYIAKMLARDKARVRQNDLLVVLQSTANYQHVLTLDTLVERWQVMSLDSFQLIQPPRGLELGDIQADYSDFVQNLEQFKFGLQTKTQSVRAGIGSIRQQIAQLERSIGFDRKALERLRNLITRAQDYFNNQETLFRQELISRADYERERQKVVELERQYDQLEEKILRTQNEITGLRKSINDTSFSNEESSVSSSTRLFNSLGALGNSIGRWKQTFLLVAPIDGRVSLNAQYFSEKQYVRQGDQVVVIVPPQSDKIVGRISLPVAGSGKVKPGQRVIIKLDSYPYHEFGTLQGLVVSKSLVPKDDLYAILIALPNGLQTSYKRDIPFEQQLQGKAEIVTEDRGFLERISEQVFAGIR